MKWFQVDSDTPNDPKIRAVLRQMGPAGMGGLFLLWCHIGDHGKRPGWSVDSTGKPMPEHELVIASELKSDEFLKLVAICTSSGHFLKSAWERRRVIAIPAMARRADTYTRRRVRTVCAQDANKVGQSSSTTQHNTGQTNTDISQTLFVPKRADCAYCGATPDQTGWRLELDHIRPQSAGGSDDPSNLVWACHVCNQAKKARVFESFEAARDWLHQAYWTSKRKRWLAHRPFAFGGQPPASLRVRGDGIRRGSVCPHEPRCETRHACIDRILEDGRRAAS